MPAERPLDDQQNTPALTFYSHADRPLAELSLLRKSLLFAELSYIAYMPRADAGRHAMEFGFPETRFYDEDGAQAYIFANERDAVVACRGTEPHDWRDVEADLNALSVLAETAGRVHRGFKSEVDHLWPRLEHALTSNRKPLWFTGHSLGGAMAAICAGRCKLSFIESNPQALFTYGAPRVGDRRYVNYVRLEYYRWVNNNDIVPRVPPAWFGYRHAGTEMYLDRRYRLRKVTGWRRFRDRWWGFVGGVRRWQIDHFSDHNLSEYLKGIRLAIEKEEGIQFEPNLTSEPPHVAAPQFTHQSSASASTA